MNQISLMLVITGVVLILGGLLFAGNLGPLGKLPGDIRVERSHFSFYFPIVTSLLLSVGLTLAFWIIQKLFR